MTNPPKANTLELLLAAVCRYGTNVLAAAALPDLSYIVGGCMDNCVHIWHFTASPEAAAAARMKAEEARAAGGGGEASDAADRAELIEFSCGGYTAKVSGCVFNGSNTMLATSGGTQSTVWDFKGPQGPAGSIPVVGLGHTKTVTCQVCWWVDWQLLSSQVCLRHACCCQQHLQCHQTMMPRLTPPLLPAAAHLIACLLVCLRPGVAAGA